MIILTWTPLQHLSYPSILPASNAFCFWESSSMASDGCSTQPPAMSANTAPPTLDAVPLEIQNQIFSYLDHRTLIDLTLMNRAIFGAATMQLYADVKPTSMYRFAQFVSTVSHSKHHAAMVYHFRLLDTDMQRNEMWRLAGWMEWKYRNCPTFAARAPEGSAAASERNYHTKHPLSNQVLDSSKPYRSPPMGAILHVLAACKNLRSVKSSIPWKDQLLIANRSVSIQFMGLSQDYAIVTPAYPKTAFTSLAFTSDVGRSWTSESQDIEPVAVNMMIQSLVDLPQLRRLCIRKSQLFRPEFIQTVLGRCTSLEYAYFKATGHLSHDLDCEYRPSTKRKYKFKGRKEIEDQVRLGSGCTCKATL